MTDLTQRQEKLLAFVVQDYVESASPVGSEALRRRGLGVSSATIRNDLATLEDAGYLTHPHTSSGRVPTEEGYRYFVRTLMEESDLPVAERRMISHQFHQVILDVEQWMRLTAAVVARTAHSAAFVTAPQSPRSRFKHLQLISINDQVALLVLVLRGGAVKQHMLTLALPMSQEELTTISNRLNARLAGNDTDEIQNNSAMLSGFEQEVANILVDLMRQADRHTSHEVFHDGIGDALRQPEFSEIDRTKSLFAVLEQSDLLDEILRDLAPSRGVQVIIGSEMHRAEMSDFSIVLARYGSPDASGVVSVVGPMRMPYARSIGVVRYVSGLLDNLITRMFGS